MIQKSVNFASKDHHKAKCLDLFKTMKKTPSLKAFGVENMDTKKLLSKNSDDDKKRSDGSSLGTIPQLTQAQKLNAYMKSISISEKLQKEFETEFEELVLLIINIGQRS